ncbi:MAG TPA: DUF3276 family protein [Blastocatellia bacterium]|jgi:uncharacterized protein YlaN (UPF0358 family)|nr:DUF3276 family protein [Blastocatellia bacterium]
MSEIFSEKVVTRRRTYYFDVKETKDGSKYLVIGELTQVGSELERHRVMVFEESLDSFMDGLDKAVEFILNGERGEEGDERPRQEDGEDLEVTGHNRDVIKMLKRVEKKIDQVREHFR